MPGLRQQDGVSYDTSELKPAQPATRERKRGLRVVLRHVSAEKGGTLPKKMQQHPGFWPEVAGGWDPTTLGWHHLRSKRGSCIKSASQTSEFIRGPASGLRMKINSDVYTGFTLTCAK